MPILPRKSPPYWPLQPSSSSTAEQTAPDFLIRMDDDSFLRVLDDPNLQQVLDQKVDPIMVEASHEIEREGDVERAISLYLLHTVNQILARYLVRKRLIQDDSQFFCFTRSKEHSSVVDVLWKVKSVDVLALELKNWGAIRIDTDWDPAILPISSPEDALEAAIEQKIADGVQLGENATVLLKQLVKYHSAYDTPYVLACDWGNMMCLDMEPNGLPWNDDDVDENSFPEVLYTAGSAAGSDALTFHKMVIAAFLQAVKRLDGKIKSAMPGPFLPHVGV
ncbi:hypothetical protein FB45DRAFT_1032204 [Roridomyces roridus]|uniref:Uncharacterized protein n=1 Tax=Roridomyces roridus TaxID=1738132 RepID=A0AAD7B0Q0_9AGAR|nr:hypothetical protein FB45DRAFT_1040864 [Roridomyces roridus]KAJ7620930.1 hypothetical protein FB45DRAFT_1032204 [Roridomyces roridus]